jgi:hypothetical protein
VEEVVMRQGLRWLVAVLVAVIATVVVLWVAGAVVLPWWIKAESDRWVIAACVAAVVGGVVTAWGVSFAQREDKADGEPEPDVQMKGTASDRGRVNQAAGDQTIGTPRVAKDVPAPARRVRMEGTATGDGQVNQSGGDQTITGQ